MLRREKLGKEAIQREKLGQTIPGEPEKSSHFKKFIAPGLLHRFESFKF